MGERQTCVNCQKLSPETDTNYTLISARYGWRLRRLERPDGTLLVEWRCPACWRAFKASGADAVPSSARLGEVAKSGTHRAVPPVPEGESPTPVASPKKGRRKSSPPPRRARG